MKNYFDLTISFILLVILFLPILLLILAIKITSNESVLYWSKRIGTKNRIFYMPKFRTMKNRTPQIASHLIKDADKLYTPMGRFLRLTSLDELPQLISIFKGDMSLVGPRPALFNQEDLIKLRSIKGLDKLKPGLTGWAQVNGRDELSIPEKVKFDSEYLQRKSFFFDLYIIWLTFLKIVKKDGVSH